MKNLIIISLCILFAGCATAFKENENFDKNIFMRKSDSNSNFTSIGKINDKELIGITNDYAKGAYKISGLLLNSNNLIIEVLDDEKFNAYNTQILKEKDEQNRKKLEEESIRNAKQYELNRVKQQIALEQKKKEDEERSRQKIFKELEEKKLKDEELLVNQIAQKNNLDLKYRNGSFGIAKSVKNQTVYIKDGAIKKEAEVKDEIEKYNQYLITQREIEKVQLAQQQERARIKEKNLSYRWVVQAQAVCSGGYQCWIKSVKHTSTNEFDGSANFSIAYESRRGSAGSSGLATIECGFNRSNTLRSTNVNAVCQ